MKNKLIVVFSFTIFFVGCFNERKQIDIEEDEFNMPICIHHGDFGIKCFTINEIMPDSYGAEIDANDKYCAELKSQNETAEECQ